MNNVQLFQLFFQDHPGDLVAGFIQILIQRTDGVGDAKYLLAYGGDPVFFLVTSVGVGPEEFLFRLCADLHQDHRRAADAALFLPEQIQHTALPDGKRAGLRRAVRGIPWQGCAVLILPQGGGVVLPERHPQTADTIPGSAEIHFAASLSSLLTASAFVFILCYYYTTYFRTGK